MQLMKKLKVEVIGFEDNDQYVELVSALASNKIPPLDETLKIVYRSSSDERVPHEIVLSLDEYGLESTASSANLLSAYTQALNRLTTKLKCRA